jgi:hypothetical protein
MPLITSHQSILQYRYNTDSIPEVTVCGANVSSATIKLGQGDIPLGNDKNTNSEGHLLLPGNLLMCYGVKNISGSASSDITFSKSFTSTNYAITFSTSTPIATFVYFNSKSNEGVTANFTSFTGTLNYIAIGY